MNKRGLLATGEIFVLVVAIVATAYLLQLPSVSAEASSCCLESGTGEICKDVTSDYDECAGELVPGSCASISSCELGCCFDPEEGLCTPRSIRQRCEEYDGTWVSEESCAVSECRKACCVLGDDVMFTTEARCEHLAGLYSVDKDFRQQIQSEPECLALAATQELSACMLGSRCDFTSEVQCRIQGGQYHAGKLCSSPELKSGCERQASIGCVEGRDEIYWFDSCGNRENVYSSDRDRSWNNGDVLERVCDEHPGNTGSETCGNCDCLLGSRCSETELGQTHVKDGAFVCRSMNCVDEDGQVRRNGESWCVYDGYVGDGRDVAGSRHWKRMCINGEVKGEGCADYRGQICTETTVENGDSGAFSMASCVVNEAGNCISFNKNRDSMIANCRSNAHCRIEEVSVDDNFRFEVCVPRYPKGFDFSDPESGEGLCSLATQTCTVVDQAVFDSDGDFKKWKNLVNSECETSLFSTEMNSFCTSLGDCGTYVNILGKGSESTRIRNAPGLSWTDFAKYAEPVDGQSATPAHEDLSALGQSALEPGEFEATQTDVEKGFALVSQISGGTGTLLSATAVSLEFAARSGKHSLGTVVGKMWGEVWDKGVAFNDPVAQSVSSYASFLSAVSIGYTIGSLAGLAFDLQGQGSFAVQIAGIAGGTFGFAAGKSAAAAASAAEAGGAAGGTSSGGLGSLALQYGVIGPTVIWAVIAVAVAVAVAKVLGIGDIREIQVTSECLPWQPPIGGADCEKCNTDPLKPCSQYRCQSLGTACVLVNEDTDSPTCMAWSDDGVPPILTPAWVGEGFLFGREEAFSTELKHEDKTCIPEFTRVRFVLESDERAQCKAEFFHTSSFDQMAGYPLEQNRFTRNHTFEFLVPSVHALEAHNVSGDIREMFANADLYVRCRDVHGNQNANEYMVSSCINSGPDLTPPRVELFAPENGGSIRYGESTAESILFVNEPAECRYDSDEGRSYEQMRGKFECATGLDDQLLNGWPCYANITGLHDAENRIYIKCRDQPWFARTENETQRNVNAQDISYTLYSSPSELEIGRIVPDDVDIEIGFEPVSVDLEVWTQGGADVGKATCSFSYGNDNYVEFLETGGDYHKQDFYPIMSGAHSISVRCEDRAGNVATGMAEFELEVDKTPPQVVRAYEETGQLVLQTDEDAECYYSLEGCRFDADTGTSMTIGFSTEHRTEWQQGETHYVKCLDVWGNVPAECSIRVTPTALG